MSKSTTTPRKPLKRSSSESELLTVEKPPVDWTPHSYQKKAIKFAVERMVAALFLDPGLGKTSIVLATFKILQKKGFIGKMFVVAPLRVCQMVWPKEAKKWKDFHGFRVELLHGPDKEEALWREADIYVINPEGLSWLLGVHKVEKVTVNKFTKEETTHVYLVEDKKRIKALHLEDAMLVVDESTKFKKSTSDRSKILKMVLKFFRRRYILTGTPVPNGLLDLFGQIYILDLGKTLGSYITSYRNTFFDPSGFGGYTWLPKEDTPKRIEKLLKPLAIRMEAADHLKLPKLILNDIYVDLPPAAWKVYKEMEKELFAQLDRGEIVTALSAGAAAGKCHQIANGGIFREEYLRAEAKIRSERWIDLHEAKLDAVEDLIEEIGGKPVLVAYDYEHDLYRLKKRFGKDTPHIGGGVSGKRAIEIEAAWNRGEIPVLLGHPASIGHGLNLQEACQHIVWHSLTYDLEFYDQFVQRVLRQGNPHTRVFNHRIVARGTLDEMILLALAEKDGTQKRFLNALKSYRKLKAA